MRHVLSLLAGLILAPLSYFVAGYGVHDIALKDAGGLHTLSINEAWLGLAMLAAAGLIYLALLLLPITPAGTILGGLLYAGIGAWYLFSPVNFLDTMHKSFLSWHNIGTAAAEPALVILAMPLLATVFSPRRWKLGKPELAQSPAGGVAYPGEVSAAPVYTPTTYTPPVYTPLGYAASEPGEATTAVPAPAAPSSSAPLFAESEHSWPTQSGQ